MAGASAAEANICRYLVTFDIARIRGEMKKPENLAAVLTCSVPYGEPQAFPLDGSEDTVLLQLTNRLGSGYKSDNVKIALEKQGITTVKSVRWTPHGVGEINFRKRFIEAQIPSDGEPEAKRREIFQQDTVLFLDMNETRAIESAAESHQSLLADK